jgi:DNA-binding transcriptional ArsR family regulator
VPRSATLDAFSAIAEPQRRLILTYLSAGERPVGAIVGAVGLQQPSVSKHLRVLHNVGLVSARRDGRQVLYRANPAALKSLHDWTSRFERLWQHH